MTLESSNTSGDVLSLYNHLPEHNGTDPQPIADGDHESPPVLRRRKVVPEEQKSDSRYVTPSPESPVEESSSEKMDGTDLIKPSHSDSRQSIHQFAIFPPPSLKAAQFEFSMALEKAIQVLNLRHQLHQLETDIHLQKQSLSSESS